MMKNDFAWTFDTDDASTIRYVRENYIPRLKADIEEMQGIVRTCLANDQVVDAAMDLQETVVEQKQKLEAAETRLHCATKTSTPGDKPEVA